MVQTAPETVFTYGAPQLKFGAGASDEIGYDLSTYDVRRVLVVTDPGVAATGHPQRITEQIRAAGIDAVLFDRAHVEPTDASLVEAVEFAREGGPWDAFVAVGGGSAIDTAKAVNLLSTNPGDVLDYVNAPVGKGRAPEKPLAPLLAVPTTTGTGSESTTVCVLDVLDQHVKSGISHPRLRPDPGGRRPAAHAVPAGRGDRGQRDGHPLPRAGELDRPAVRLLPAQDRRAAGALLRRQPDRRHVVGEGDEPARHVVPDRGARTATTRRPAGRWRWPPPSPAWASATPACTSRTRTPTRSRAGSGTSTRRATRTTTRWCRTAWPSR